jgi:hypothetical protein
LSELLDLERLPQSFLLQHVKPSGFVGDERLWGLFESLLNAEKGSKSALTIKSIRDYNSFQACKIRMLGLLAAGGCGGRQRVAVVENTACAVYVFQLETMQHILSVGRKGTGEG